MLKSRQHWPNMLRARVKRPPVVRVLAESLRRVPQGTPYYLTFTGREHSCSVEALQTDRMSRLYNNEILASEHK
jgi:hypothetical protein